MYVTNENSDTIAPVAIDSASGELSPTADVIGTGSPVCIPLR